MPRHLLKILLAGAIATGCSPEGNQAQPIRITPTPRTGTLCAGGIESVYVAQQKPNSPQIEGVQTKSPEIRTTIGDRGIITIPHGAAIFFPEGAVSGQWYNVGTVPERIFSTDGTLLRQESSARMVPYDPRKEFCFENINNSAPVFERDIPTSTSSPERR